MTPDTPGDDGDDARADAASPEDVERLADEYRAAGRPFARVTVVRREPPVSANVGDRALVTPDGDLVGWVGGVACARSVAVDEATAALERGDPSLVGLAPDPDEVDRPGLTAYPMTCHSGGTLELFVEPVTPVPRLVVVGDSPVARSLARLAGETDFDVTVVTGPDTTPAVDEFPGADAAVSVADGDALADALDGAMAAVVATLGEYDEPGLDAALRASLPYVGLVASDVRRDELAETVAAGLDADADTVVDAVTTPAGLDIGAETPGEIAVSVLAELVAVRHGATDAVGSTAADGRPDEHGTGSGHDHGDDGDRDGDAAAGTVVDPVCGMDVVVDEAAATVTHRGETYRFCGEGCAEAFEDDPDRYLAEVVTGE